MSIARPFKQVNSLKAILTFPVNLNSFWIPSTIQRNDLASEQADYRPVVNISNQLSAQLHPVAKDDMLIKAALGN